MFNFVNSTESAFETAVKKSIQTYFAGIEIYMEKDISSRFGSYMTGIDICIVHSNKIICLKLKQIDTKSNVKEMSHFVFCCNKLSQKYPQIVIYKILASSMPPTKQSIDLLSDEHVYSICNYNQETLLQQLLNMINNILIGTPEFANRMEIC